VTHWPSHFVLYCNGTDREGTAETLGLPAPRHDDVELYRRGVDVSAKGIESTPQRTVALGEVPYERLDQRALICDTCQAALRIPDVDMDRLIVVSARQGQLRQELADFRALYRRATGRIGPGAK
jgi:hypothetical protein